MQTRQTAYSRYPDRTLWDFDGAVLRRHHPAFRVPHHHADQITPGGDVEGGLHRDARVQPAFQGCVKQAHLDDLLGSSHEVPIPVEQAGHDGQIVPIAVTLFAKGDLPDVDFRRDGDGGLIVRGFKELGLHDYRVVVYLVGRKEGLLDLFLGPLGGVRGVVRRVVASASLDRDPFGIPKRHLQSMILAVQLEILGGESEDVDVFRRFGRSREPRVEVVAVFDEPPAGGAGGFGHHGAIGESALAREPGFIRQGGGVDRMLAGIRNRVVRKEAARIQGVDHDVGAKGALENGGLLLASVVQHQEAVGDQNDGTLPGHHGHLAYQGVQRAEGLTNVPVGQSQLHLGGVSGPELGFVVRHLHAGANPDVGLGVGQRSRIVLVLDEVRHVDRHRRAVDGGNGDGTLRANGEQGLVQLVAVGGEIERGHAGGGVDRDALGGPDGGGHAAPGGVARARQIVEPHVRVVEKIGDETLRHGERRGLGRGRGRLGGRHQLAELLDGKLRDDLRLAVIEELEVLPFEIAGGVSLGVARDHGNRYQGDPGGERQRRYFGRDLGGGLARGRLGRLAIAAKQREKEREAEGANAMERGGWAGGGLGGWAIAEKRGEKEGEPDGANAWGRASRAGGHAY